jgi:hypothetical protein
MVYSSGMDEFENKKNHSVSHDSGLRAQDFTGGGQ